MQASDSLAGFRCDLDAGVPYLRDISYIGPQRVFDRALYASADAERALGACESGLETEVIAGNTFDYPAMHGASIARAGYSFCSASARAVERGEVRLTDYRIVDLILGKQRTVGMGPGSAGTAFRAFPPGLQRALYAFVEQGGALLVSGSFSPPIYGGEPMRFPPTGSSPAKCSESSPTAGPHPATDARG